MITKALHRPSPLDHQVLLFEHLRTLSRMTRLVDVESWAQTQGIAYKYDGKGGIWTTLDALNFALGISAPVDEAAFYPLDTPV